MKIQSLRIREGGTHVDLDDAAYHFAPNALGHHVADVTISKHLSKLLATEAFVVYDPDAQTAEADETPAAPPTVAVAAESLDDKSDADLKAIYLQLYGKAAGNKGRAKLIAEIKVKLDAQAAEIVAEPEGEQDDFDGDDEEDETDGDQ